MSRNRQAKVGVEIVRFVSDEPQPGMVECVLVDVDGVCHSIIDKAPVFSAENLLATSVYPRAGVLACEVEAEWTDEIGRRLARIYTEKPWGIEAINGRTHFVVLSSAVRDR